MVSSPVKLDTSNRLDREHFFSLPQSIVGAVGPVLLFTSQAKWFNTPMSDLVLRF